MSRLPLLLLGIAVAGAATVFFIWVMATGRLSGDAETEPGIAGDPTSDGNDEDGAEPAPRGAQPPQHARTPSQRVGPDE